MWENKKEDEEEGNTAANFLVVSLAYQIKAEEVLNNQHVNIGAAVLYV